MATLPNWTKIATDVNCTWPVLRQVAQIPELTSLRMSVAFHIYLYGVGRGAIPISFEQIAERLTEVERIYFEMDGSFVWTGETDHGRWQLDGMIYDAVGSVQYVDVKGTCPWNIWQLFLAILGGEKGWSEDWTVLRLPEQEQQTLMTFNQETWKACGD